LMNNNVSLIRSKYILDEIYKYSKDTNEFFYSEMLIKLFFNT